MKNLILILTLGFSLFSCVKKEDEIIKPICQKKQNIICKVCNATYEIEQFSYKTNEIIDSQIYADTFVICSEFDYQPSAGVIIKPTYEFDSLGFYYETGYTIKDIITLDCKYKN
jgi:hypothetical protein